MGKNETTASSKMQDWVTPRYILDPLHEEFGFEWDCAAYRHTAVTRRLGVTHKARYFGPDHPNPQFRDALAFDWSVLVKAGIKTVWCNPPYGRGVGRWMKQLRRASEQGLTVVALLYSRTETKWFQQNAWACAEISLADGRIVFLNQDTGLPDVDAHGRPTAATAGHALYIWRPGHSGPPVFTAWRLPTRPTILREEFPR